MVTLLLNRGSNIGRWGRVVPLIAGCVLSGRLWAPCVAQEQAIHEAGDTAVTGVPEHIRDSIGIEVRKLREEAQELRKQANLIRDSVVSLRIPAGGDTTRNPGYYVSDISVEQGHREKDTVQLLSRETTCAFLESINGKKRTARERGYGGGIGPSMGIYAMNLSPVGELLDYLMKDAAFRNAGLKIDEPYTLFQLSGVCFYGAVGNGLRIGGNFLGGSRSYSSHHDDTTFNLEINPSFGGLIIEKAAVYGNCNLLYGGMIGGGKIEVCPSKTTNLLTFMPLQADNEKMSFSTVKAQSLLLEMHGGFTYTMINWFHMGAELSAPVFFSPSGFVTKGGHNITSGFVSLNPGIRIRIIIGNIG